MEIRGVAGPQERETVRSLLRSEFEVAPGVGKAFANLYDNLLDRDPSVRPDHSRVALREGRVVGHALLAPRQLRLSGGDCPAGLVGLVVVHPDHRYQGIGTALLNDLFSLARESGLGILILAGDPGYYSRFGFHTAFTVAEGRLPSATAGTAVGLRSASLEDLSLLEQLAAAAAPCGSVIPNEERWQWRLETGHPGGLLASNPTILGHVAKEDQCLIESTGQGYVRLAVGEDRATVYEIGGSPSVLATLSDAIVQWCEERGIADVRLRLPEQDPLWTLSGLSKQTR